MRVICPKCGAPIEVTFTSFHPLRHGANDMSAAIKSCQEVATGAAKVHPGSPDILECSILDAAIVAAATGTRP